MSRTTRRLPADPPRELWDNPDRIPLRPWEQAAFCRHDKHGFQILPDGKRTWAVEVQRDNRATGLRQHKRHRRQTRQELQASPPEAADPIAGKVRRYNQCREEYRL